jgi:radical SAM superfamily enzyme YgiQ (UPF0313 family)
MQSGAVTVWNTPIYPADGAPDQSMAGGHMGSRPRKTTPSAADSETGTIRKSWRGRTRVVLIYPNDYHVGMSSLGFQAVYRQLNDVERVVCERAFLPKDAASVAGPLKTVESGRPAADADIIAFSISFENDYPNVLDLLNLAGLPLRSEHRTSSHPLVVAGGVACWLNPEPLAAFIDCFLVGESEAILPRFLEIFESKQPRASLLLDIAREVPGAYIPRFYRAEYDAAGTIATFSPTVDVPRKVTRVYLNDLSESATCSTVLTPETTFDSSCLIEVGRGCPHGCRFCSAGYIYRPPRFRPVSMLSDQIARSAERTSAVGLVGAAVSDLPHIDDLCRQAIKSKIRLHFSSLRADQLTPELLAVLKNSRVKTATIAPDAGSERMRRVINKGIDETAVLRATAALVENGIPNLKLYFMVGLPTETDEDVEAIISLCKRIKHHFLSSSRIRKKIGTITISVNSFVPKPATPFQWVGMDDTRALKTKIRKIKTDLRRVPNLRIHSDVPRWAYIQALLSRGDRKTADVLSLLHANGGNWAQTLKMIPHNPDFYVLRTRERDERFPWDFIDHGVTRSFLWKEYRLALRSRVSPDCPMTVPCPVCGVCHATASGAV